MNSTITPITAAEFVVAFPQLFQQCQNVILLETAFAEEWRKADTAHFDDRVKAAQQALNKAESAAERIYRARIAEEFALMETTNRDAQATLNCKLSDLLTKLAEDEAPLFHERDGEIARLRAIWAAMQETCRELQLQSAAAPGGNRAEHQAALRAVDERCEILRAPLRTRYQADVAEAFDVYNAALAASRKRYAEFENGVALDRKRALVLAERIKHEALLQVAYERDEATETRREWCNRLKSSRQHAFVFFLANPDHVQALETKLMLRAQKAALQERARELGLQLPVAWMTPD